MSTTVVHRSGDGSASPRQVAALIGAMALGGLAVIRYRPRQKERQ